MSKLSPREFRWSSEDQATFAIWRRWMLIIYGGIGLVMTIAAFALRLAGG